MTGSLFHGLRNNPQITQQGLYYQLKQCTISREKILNITIQFAACFIPPKKVFYQTNQVALELPHHFTTGSKVGLL